MQENHKYFMSDEDYKKFRKYVFTEMKNYNNGLYCFEKAMQNVMTMVIENCYDSSKSWAFMIAEIAEENDIDELLKICKMRVAFDKPKIKC